MEISQLNALLDLLKVTISLQVKVKSVTKTFTSPTGQTVGTPIASSPGAAVVLCS